MVAKSKTTPRPPRSKTGAPSAPAVVPDADDAASDGLLPEERAAHTALDRQVERPQPRREKAVALRIERRPPSPEALTVDEVRVRLAAGERPAASTAATAAVIPVARFGEIAAAGGPFGWAEANLGPGAYRAVWVAKDLRELAVEAFEVPDLDAARAAREREWARRVDAHDEARAREAQQRRVAAAADAAARSFVEAAGAAAGLGAEERRTLRRDVVRFLREDEPALLADPRPWVVRDRLFAAFSRRLGLVPVERRAAPARPRRTPSPSFKTLARRRS